jgi:hypothetical protein
MTDLSAEQAIVDWLLQDFQTPASKSSPKVALARPTSAQLKPAQASFYFFPRQAIFSASCMFVSLRVLSGWLRLALHFRLPRCNIRTACTQHNAQRQHSCEAFSESPASTITVPPQAQAADRQVSTTVS